MGIKVVLIGFGPLGRMMAEDLMGRSGFKLTGVVDIDPGVAGKDPGELVGKNPTGISITTNIIKSVDKIKPDCALVTTVSDLERITPTLLELLSYGLPIVSTCEELSYPWFTQPELAEKIDTAGKNAGVAVLGTGVNPGFLMDTLPAVLTGVCKKVESIKISRIQDASHRRIPFQKKIGAGLSMEEFEKKKAEGSLRHVGLTESMHLIAAGVNWELDRTEDIIEPAVAKSRIITKGLTLEPGQAAGVIQTGRGFRNGKEVITLYFHAALGADNPRETVEITGDPSFTSTIPGGINGDTATCAISLNALGQILNAKPGLRTMADMEPISCYQPKETE